MRKLRLWVCTRCGSAYHRHKGAYAEEPVRCRVCGGVKFRRGRSFTVRMERAQTNYRRQLVRKQQETEKIVDRHSRTRNAYGHLLHISRDTHRAWTFFMRSKNRRSFENRAQKFVDAVALDIWTCRHYRPANLAMLAVGSAMRPKDCHCRLVKGGLLQSPAFLVDEQFADWGDFRSGLGHLLRGAEKMPRAQTIRVRRKGDSDAPGTVLHEVQHWIDTYSIDKAASRCAGSHSRAFYDRVRWLAKKFRYEIKDGPALGH